MPVTNQGSNVKAGMVGHYAANAIPDGWLKANGAAVSRAAYAALFAAIGTTYGAGDGATTFNLPDLRGEFVRGLDDGRGVDTGRALGSAQSDAIRNITGSFSLSSNLGIPSGAAASGAFSKDTGTSYTNAPSGAAATGYPIKFNASAAVPTASENRPRNVAMMACIKY